jgi:glycosyltransferase involved in cell wall biosynthesis
MIRVVQVIAGLDIGRSVGGAEAFALRLAQLLPRDEFAPGLFVLWRADTEIEAQWLAHLDAAEIPVYGLHRPTGRLPLDLRRAGEGLWACVDHHQPHLLNSHSERGDLLNLMMKGLHPRHPAAVQTVHLDRQWGTQPYFGALFNHLAAPLGFDQQVVVAATIRDLLDARPLARLLGRRAHLLYNGIDAAAFAQPCHTPTVRPGPARIGVVGRLAEQKGHIDLLHALAWVRQVLPVKLWVVGDGPREGALRQTVAQLGLVEEVEFLGRREDVPRLLAELDLLVSSSWWEGFPTVILEAMAAGVPVVATDVSGSRELVQSGVTGMLVPPHKPTALAAAMIGLLTNPPAAAALAVRAHRFAQQFTMQATAQAYAALYRTLAGDGMR